MLNRKVKFRVWSNKHHQWMNHCAVIDCNGNIGSHFIEVKENKEILEHFVALSQDENVVQQFTGILDKNGKEIYEGDILKDVHNYNSNTFISIKIEVKFGTVGEIIGFYYRHFGNIEGMSINKNNPQITNEKDIEVIGNIFETPELLKLN